jgi:hypothetical protein
MTREESENMRDLMRLMILRSQLGLVHSLFVKLTKGPNAAQFPQCSGFLLDVDRMRDTVSRWIDLLGKIVSLEKKSVQ